MADEQVDPTTPVTPPAADEHASAPAETSPVEPAAADPGQPEEVVEAELVEPTEANALFPPPEPSPEPAPYAEQPAAPQYVVVEAPREPRRRGNRGIGSLLAVAGAVIFGALLVGATYLLNLAAGGDGFGFVLGIKFYLPIIIFVIAFVLLVLIANRGAWWAYILGSLIVGLVVYFGTAAAGVGADQVSEWLGQKPSGEVISFADALTRPFVIISAVLAREVALWWGWLIAHRGRRMTAKNRVAREDFDRQLADFHARYGASTPV